MENAKRDRIRSMIAEMANGDQCEYGCIGREGMLGLQNALGAQQLRGRALCQLEGTALRIDGSALRALTASNDAQRTARWLLQSRDRAGADEFGLTQEFLARMLGVRRASVTRAAGELQRMRIIDDNRGRIRVLDAVALEANCCECYALMHAEFAVVFAGGIVGPGYVPYRSV